MIPTETTNNSLVQDTTNVEDYSGIVNSLFEEIQLMCLTEPGIIDDLTDRIVMLEKKARQVRTCFYLLICLFLLNSSKQTN
jgi:hypothetical protein